jgi:LmbE family N-acetylglucosaminyl deacetylase
MERVRGWVRGAMLRAARDVTEATAGRSALVLAPHPDDETLGCGATILRKRAAGTTVTVAVVTDGRHSHRSPHVTPDQLAELRRGELGEAVARLGLTPDALRTGGFVDGELAAREDELVGYVAGLLKELAPDEVYTTSADEAHPDHAALGRAARRAAAAADQPVRLLEYPVWLWGSWPLSRGRRLGSTADAAGRLLRRRVTKVRVDGYRADKLHALDAHRSQLVRPEMVPADADWPVLPRHVLAAAGDRAELFLPWR